jgi:hypothetical protein
MSQPNWHQARSMQSDTLVIELIEANETPAVVIIRWPAKPSVLHPRRFPPLLMPLHGSSLPPSCGWPRFDGTGSGSQPAA